MTLVKRTAIVMAAAALAASLAGCATAPPFSLEEELWFDKATGADITRVPPGLRMHGPVGYPHPIHRYHPRPPELDEP